MVEPTDKSPPEQTPPPYDTRENWANWKKQVSWASRDAKKSEVAFSEQVASNALATAISAQKTAIESRLEDHTNAAKQLWRKLRRNYEVNRDEYTVNKWQWMKEHYDRTIMEIAQGDIIEAGCSDDTRLDNTKLVEMQQIIAHMANVSGLFKRIPKLIIHTQTSHAKELHKSNLLFAGVKLPDFIETNQYSVQYFLKHMDEFKMIMAHELGHLANGDRNLKAIVNRNITSPNQVEENLANMMGAIIYGNPREYAAIDSKALFSRWHESIHHAYTHNYLSPNGIARMLHKWADILEHEGATDKETGNIIDRKKALEIFERSKHVLKYADAELRNLIFSDAYKESLKKRPAPER